MNISNFEKDIRWDYVRGDTRKSPIFNKLLSSKGLSPGNWLKIKQDKISKLRPTGITFTSKETT